MPTLPSGCPLSLFASHLVLHSCLLALPGLLHAQQPVPRFQPAECPFEGGEWLEEEDIDCGYLIVAENRKVDGGRTLRLAVAIARSRSEEPRPDPVVWLQGGPGGSTVSAMRAVSTSPFWAALRSERDVIFFDQRGTGLSEPEFCPEFNRSMTGILYLDLPVEERRAARLEATRDCRGRMLAQGVDFSVYNSAASAQDLADLRQALGYETWNLLGGSYGTRLALTAMRDAPQGIRSVILSATSPPNATRWAESLANYDRSLRLLFDQCAADPECAAEYGDLEQVFFSALEELEAEPLVVEMPDTAKFPAGRLVLDGEVLAAAVFQALYFQPVITVLPLAIRELKARNSDALLALADGLAPDPGRISQGFFYSVECYEVAPFSPPDAVRAAQDRFPRLAKFNYYVGQLDEHAVCDAWHSERAGPIENQPVRSEIPTLIMAGEFDPITPPSYGRLAAETLPNSYYAEVRAAGHGAGGSDCVRGIYKEFFASPMRAPDFSCLDERETVRFVTGAHINGGVYRLGSALQGDSSTSVLTIVGVLVIVLLSALLGWPLGYAIRRWRKRPLASGGTEKIARWLAWFATLSAVVFLGGLTAVILRVAADNPMVLGFGVPGTAAWLFVLPRVALVLTLAVIASLVLAWRRGFWGMAGRLHYSLVVLACIGFLWFVGYWKLI